MDHDAPRTERPAADLGPDRTLVQQRLEQRFPDVPANDVAEAIDRAAEPTAAAKIQTFRPLLVEHRASDELLKVAEPDGRTSQTPPPESAAEDGPTDPDARIAEMADELEQLRGKIEEARRSAATDPYLETSVGEDPDVTEGEQQAP